MNFWQNLKAASSLATGNVWDLITHPRVGGTGIVVNTGAQAVFKDMSMSVAVTDNYLSVAVRDTAPVATVTDTAMAVVISTKPINV